MSHLEKLEQALELLINEEQDKAKALLHDVIVGKSRSIYEELEATIESEIEEGMRGPEFGDDEKEDFMHDVERDEEEVDAEGYMEADDEEAEDDMPMGDEMPMDMDDEMPEEEVEDRVEDLEAKLAELTAKFDELMADEMDEPEHQDMEMDMMPMDDEPEVEGYYEGKECDEAEEVEESDEPLEEATKLQDEVADPGMGSEGHEAAKGSSVKVDKEAPYTKAPSKEHQGGEPHKINDGSDGNQKPMDAKHDNGFGAEDNIDVDHKAAPEAKKDPKDDDKSAKSTLGQ